MTWHLLSVLLPYDWLILHVSNAVCSAYDSYYQVTHVPYLLSREDTQILNSTGTNTLNRCLLLGNSSVKS